jgi:hypothetical protein
MSTFWNHNAFTALYNSMSSKSGDAFQFSAFDMKFADHGQIGIIFTIHKSTW